MVVKSNLETQSEQTSFWVLLWLIALELFLEILFSRTEPPFFFGKEIPAYIISAWITLVFGLIIVRIFKSPLSLFTYGIFLSLLLVVMDIYAAYFGDYPSIRMLGVLDTGAEFWDTPAYYINWKHLLALALPIVSLSVFLFFERKGRAL